MTRNKVKHRVNLKRSLEEQEGKTSQLRNIDVCYLCCRLYIRFSFGQINSGYSGFTLAALSLKGCFNFTRCYLLLSRASSKVLSETTKQKTMRLLLIHFPEDMNILTHLLCKISHAMIQHISHHRDYLSSWMVVPLFIS